MDWFLKRGRIPPKLSKKAKTRLLEGDAPSVAILVKLFVNELSTFIMT